MLMVGNIYKLVTLVEVYPQQWRKESYLGILINYKNPFVEILDNELGFVKIEKKRIFEAEEVGKENGNVDLF